MVIPFNGETGLLSLIECIPSKEIHFSSIRRCCNMLLFCFFSIENFQQECKDESHNCYLFCTAVIICIWRKNINFMQSLGVVVSTHTANAVVPAVWGCASYSFLCLFKNRLDIVTSTGATAVLAKITSGCRRVFSEKAAAIVYKAALIPVVMMVSSWVYWHCCSSIAVVAA